VQLETAWPVLGHPGHKTKAVPLTQDQFAKGFASAVPREEADALYLQYGIPSPALPLFEASEGALSSHTAANVDTKHERGPLLMIAGGADRTVPEATVHAAFKIQSHNDAVTEYHVFEGRGHSQGVDHGWRDWDPALLEVLSAEREIIVFDYPGVNLSSGTTPGIVAGLARSVAEFISALGLQYVDLLGWSMGGYVVQDLCLNNPGLVRRLVIAASGPGAVPGTPAPPDKLRQVAAKPVNDDEDFLYMFFPETGPSRRAGLASLRRLDTRLAESGADTVGESVAAQGAALTRWARGEHTSWDRLGELTLPILVGGGAHDLLMHPYGTYAMALRLPDAKVIFYTDSGHGFLFQHSGDFGQEVLNFTR
jgi:pimeloyl-ACP methyl ester carboxylesterase